MIDHTSRGGRRKDDGASVPKFQNSQSFVDMSVVDKQENCRTVPGRNLLDLVRGERSRMMTIFQNGVEFV